MASNYPTSLDTTATLPSAGSVGANLSTFPHSALTGNVNDAVIAIETELGVAPSGADTTVKARLDRITPVLGALTNWTPTLHQNTTAVPSAVGHATWSRSGRAITARFAISATAGTNAVAGLSILVGFSALPASQYSFGAVGTAYFFDNSSGFTYTAILALASTTTLQLLGMTPGTETRLGVTGSPFTTALQTNDTLTGTFDYQSATD